MSISRAGTAPTVGEEGGIVRRYGAYGIGSYLLCRRLGVAGPRGGRDQGIRHTRTEAFAVSLAFGDNDMLYF